MAIGANSGGLSRSSMEGGKAKAICTMYKRGKLYNNWTIPFHKKSQKDTPHAPFD
jgi:hypothetical protein